VPGTFCAYLNRDDYSFLWPVPQVEQYLFCSGALLRFIGRNGEIYWALLGKNTCYTERKSMARNA
jgi:hypothetical protein